MRLIGNYELRATTAFSDIYRFAVNGISLYYYYLRVISAAAGKMKIINEDTRSYWFKRNDKDNRKMVIYVQFGRCKSVCNFYRKVAIHANWQP